MWLLIHLMLGLGTPRPALLAAVLTILGSQLAGAQLSIPVTTVRDFAGALQNPNVGEIILDPSGTGVIASLIVQLHRARPKQLYVLHGSLKICLLQSLAADHDHSVIHPTCINPVLKTVCETVPYSCQQTSSTNARVKSHLLQPESMLCL